MNNINLSDYLRTTLSGGSGFNYLPNHGNAGDALMATAAFDLFDHLGLTYSPLFTSSMDQDFSGKTLVLGGGGNFNEGGYNHYAAILSKWGSRAKKIIVLPHTVSGNRALLSGLGGNVDIICRERKSYQHVVSSVGRANVFLTHDMAFGLDVKRILSRRKSYSSILTRRALTSLLRLKARNNYPRVREVVRDFWEFSELRRFPERKDVINVFRTDMERTNIFIPDGNIDLSLRFQYGIKSRSLSEYMTDQFFAYLDHFNSIRTNRLHVCIAGALLGKKVELFSNNYHKIQSVYDFSIKNRFENVIWHS